MNNTIGYTTSVNQTYLAPITETLNFSDAQQFCRDYFGTNLARIDSAEEDAEARDLCGSIISVGDNGCYIGLYQPDVTAIDPGTSMSSWQWILADSSEDPIPDYYASNWGVNEPQGSTLENCGAIWISDATTQVPTYRRFCSLSTPF